jgi:hypothetical protein
MNSDNLLPPAVKLRDYFAPRVFTPADQQQSAARAPDRKGRSNAARPGRTHPRALQQARLLDVVDGSGWRL